MSGHNFQGEIWLAEVSNIDRETDRQSERWRVGKALNCAVYRENGRSFISEIEAQYSTYVLGKCDSSSLLKSLLKLPST